MWSEPFTLNLVSITLYPIRLEWEQCMWGTEGGILNFHGRGEGGGGMSLEYSLHSVCTSLLFLEIFHYTVLDSFHCI